jgi:hypothetical protein
MVNGSVKMVASAQGIVFKGHLWRGKVRVKDLGEIHFVLYTEMGSDIIPNQDFEVSNKDLRIKLPGKTDANGEFRHSPAKFGEYTLKVGMAVFRIPAVTSGSPPFLVHVPLSLLPNKWAWKGPTEEESTGIAST